VLAEFYSPVCLGMPPRKQERVWAKVTQPLVGWKITTDRIAFHFSDSGKTQRGEGSAWSHTASVCQRLRPLSPTPQSNTPGHANL
jgi:hypothetical protein